MKAIWNWIKSLFGGGKIGVIWRLMFTAGKNAVAEMVSDPKNQAAALDLAKSLMSSGKTAEEKREAFNTSLRAWAKTAGVKLTEAAINALRENAVVALKCEGCCTDCTP